MKEIWTDRRIFISVLGLIISATMPASAPFVAAITGAYLANRAYSDSKEAVVQAAVKEVVE